MNTNRRAQRKEILRQDILDAASDILQNKGIEMLTMRAIADRVLHSASALYEHFPHKDAICEELAYGILRDLTATLQTLPREGQSAEARVMSIAKAVYAFSRDNWKRYVLSLQLRLPTMRSEITEIRTIFGQAIAALNYPYLKDEKNLGRALEVFRTFLEGVCSVAGTNRYAGKDQMATEVIENGINGLLIAWKNWQDYQEKN